MKPSPQILQNLKTKKIIILGLAREGQSTYHFLRKHLPQKQLAVADQKSLSALPPKLQQQFKKDQNLELKLGSNHLENLDQYDLIFKTPGIPASLPPIKQAVTTGAKISSNFQLFLDIIDQYKQDQQQPVNLDNPQLVRKTKEPILAPLTIGITGTKGKSTTSSLISHILKANNIETILVGNIGRPALDEIDQITSKTKLVLELSSHQLETLTTSPDIAVIQKVSCEHLDYYPNQQAYIDSKKSIAMYQKVNQYIIYNPRFNNTKEIGELSPGTHLFYSFEPAFDIKVNLKSHYLTFRYRDQKPEKIIEVDQIPLLGKHNLLNVMPAIIAAKLLKLSVNQIKQAIGSFTPLPHRLELVANKGGVKYINDSMATMPDAQLAALKTFKDSDIVLIAGGHERDQDFSHPARFVLTHNVPAVILFPPTGQRFWQTVLDESEKLKEDDKRVNLPECHFVESMQKAVRIASEKTEKGGVVLMSPGAASFGVFENYADRGEQFRQAARKI